MTTFNWPLVLRSRLKDAQAENSRLRILLAQSEQRVARIEDERSRRAHDTFALALEVLNATLSKGNMRLVGESGRAEMAMESAQSKEMAKPVWSELDERVMESYTRDLMITKGLTKQEAFEDYLHKYGNAEPSKTLVWGA